MPFSEKLAVLGAGIMGLTVAQQALSQGFQVTLYDANPKQGCSHVAAAMLAPYCELDQAEPLISEMGLLSLKIWDQLVAKWTPNIDYHRTGTLVIAHNTDDSDFHRLKNRIQALFPKALSPSPPEHPLLRRFPLHFHVTQEGYIDGSQFLEQLMTALIAAGLQRKDHPPPETLEKTDWIIDCRGLWAQKDWPTLRAVRGELLIVRSDEVKLPCPLRLMHPRYPLYIVPRPNQRFIIGASSLESAATGPLTVRSALELLSAAYSVDPAFGEAQILHSQVGLRPAFPNNLPAVKVTRQYLALNGLYRHGFLLAPFLAQELVHYCKQRTWKNLPQILIEEALCAS